MRKRREFLGKRPEGPSYPNGVWNALQAFEVPHLKEEAREFGDVAVDVATGSELEP